MKLSENARIVLAVSQLDADLSVSEIAKRSGLKPHVVRNVLQTIENSKLVKRVTYIDVYPLGLAYYGVYASLTPRAKLKNKVLSHLRESQTVSFLAQTDGELNYNFDIVASKPSEVFRALDELNERFEGALVSKQVVLIESLMDFTMKFLAPKISSARMLGFGRTSPSVTIDLLDHRILSCLSHQDDHNLSALARELGVKINTLQYRIERLKEKNVILGSRFIPDLVALGFSVVDLLVRTKGMSSSTRKLFIDYCSRQLPIYAVLRIAGEWDYLVTAACEQPSLVTEIVDKMSDTFSETLTNVSAYSVLKWHKISFYPFGDKTGPFEHLQ